MIEIGENLKFERFEVKDIDNTGIILSDKSNRIKTVPFTDILNFELTGIKNNSGFCGTMEWSMSNPTFLLPANFWYNILSWFKRQDDTAYYKITASDGSQFIAYSSNKLINKELNSSYLMNNKTKKHLS